MYGARAVLESVVRGYAETDVGVHVVWAPMLDSDNEAAARQTGKMFADSRVRQYWDPNRRVGTIFAEQVYPGYADDAYTSLKKALPDDHAWRSWPKENTGTQPLWDVAFVYKPGASWSQKPPVPDAMVKQIFFYGQKGGAATGMFFTEFKKPPRDGDWIAEMATAMTSLTGHDPKKPVDHEQRGSNVADSKCQGTKMAASIIALKLPDLNEQDVQRLERALAAVEGVMRASFDLDSRIMSVLVETDGAPSAARVLKFLELAGYQGRVASEDELEQALNALQAGGPLFIQRGAPRGEAESSSDEPDEGEAIDDMTILADSLDPLRDHFNADKSKDRFLAILSPT